VLLPDQMFATLFDRSGVDLTDPRNFRYGSGIKCHWKHQRRHVHGLFVVQTLCFTRILRRRRIRDITVPSLSALFVEKVSMLPRIIEHL
jgi:hypothetical protein